MGKVVPLKQFEYVVEIDGLDTFLVQEVTLPERSVDVTEHGEGNIKRKTPGMVMIGQLVLKKLIPADTADTWAFDWFNQVQNTQTGVGTTTFFRNVVIRLKDNAGSSKKVFQCIECFPSKIVPGSLNSTSSDNVMEEVTLEVNDYTVS
jgi:phage tail-like protein